MHCLTRVYTWELLKARASAELFCSRSCVVCDMFIVLIVREFMYFPRRGHHYGERGVTRRESVRQLFNQQKQAKQLI